MPFSVCYLFLNASIFLSSQTCNFRIVFQLALQGILPETGSGVLQSRMPNIKPSDWRTSLEDVFGLELLSSSAETCLRRGIQGLSSDVGVVGSMVGSICLYVSMLHSGELSAQHLRIGDAQRTSQASDDIDLDLGDAELTDMLGGVDLLRVAGECAGGGGIKTFGELPDSARVDKCFRLI